MPGQSREELQAWADAVAKGEHPYVHIPANSDFKPVGVEGLTRTPVKGAGPFSGTYYHSKNIEAAEIRKAARDKKNPQGMLDALEAQFKGEPKPIELKAEDVEPERSPAVSSEAPKTEQPENKPEAKTSELPADISKSKPRYGYRDKNFEVDFEDPTDLAAYTLTRRHPTKRMTDSCNTIGTSSGPRRDSNLTRVESRKLSRN